MRDAVWPSGGRVRPTLTLAVAKACGDPDPELSVAAAAAVEFIHCASLVHDDLPCFDDALTRRGRPALHRAYGEPTALLVGDALIVLAFETLAMAGARAPHRLPGLISALATGVGAPSGIIAGQAWEAESDVDLAAYHRAKTGALFEAAALLGALSAGGDAAAWGAVGRQIGEAYQLADDLCDALGMGDAAGKPMGQDALLGRPNAVHALGQERALAALQDRVAAAQAAIPPCPNHATLQGWLSQVAGRLLEAIPTHAANRAEARRAG